MVAVLGILSGCRSSRDLEAFASRHREALNEALGLDFKRWPSDATFLYLFKKALLQEFGEVLQAWMLSRIPGGADGLEQLVCDGKSLRGSAIQTDEGSYRFVAKVTAYARALGVALWGLDEGLRVLERLPDWCSHARSDKARASKMLRHATSLR